MIWYFQRAALQNEGKNPRCLQGVLLGEGRDGVSKRVIVKYKDIKDMIRVQGEKEAIYKGIRHAKENYNIVFAVFIILNDCSSRAYNYKGIMMQALLFFSEDKM